MAMCQERMLKHSIQTLQNEKFARDVSVRVIGIQSRKYGCVKDSLFEIRT